MKITVEAATGIIGSGIISCKHDVYLNGKIKGWLGLFNKVEIDKVPEGENTITVMTYKTNADNKIKKDIRLTSTQDVHIWIREKPDFWKRDVYETLILGEDVTVIEEKDTEER